MSEESFDDPFDGSGDVWANALDLNLGAAVRTTRAAPWTPEP
ncbi:hypothetical protein P3L51_20630 [Streptomyces sp. PSRA5]